MSGKSGCVFSMYRPNAGSRNENRNEKTAASNRRAGSLKCIQYDETKITVLSCLKICDDIGGRARGRKNGGRRCTADAPTGPRAGPMFAHAKQCAVARFVPESESRSENIHKELSQTHRRASRQTTCRVRGVSSDANDV